jgi:TPR repeat protein
VADFRAGVEAYDRGDYAAAFAAWAPLARADDPAAQRNIGHLYRFGLGVAQDFEQAAYWYREAAEMGLAGAQANLAMMHLRGQGLATDGERAAYWFGRAAVQGHAISQYNLGILYLRGNGVRRDEARAMGWFHLAAKAGHGRALDALSKLVLDGATIYGPPPPPGWKPRPTRKSVETAASEVVAMSDVAAEVEAEAPPSPPRSEAPKPEAEAVSIDSFDTAYTVLVNAFQGDFSIPVRSEPESEASEVTDKELTDDDLAAVAPAAGEEYAALGRRTVSLQLGDEPPVARHYSRGSDDQGRLTEAMVAFHGGNYEAALTRLLPLARAGMAEAQYQLGLLNDLADYTAADRAEAYVWLTLAAERGHPKARGAQWGLIEKMDATDRKRAHGLLRVRRGGDEPKRPRL